MYFPLIVVLLVAIPSLYLIRMIERSAEQVRGASLSRWRRLLIPLPIVLFLIANLDGVLSLLSYLQTHPWAIPARYSWNRAWNTDRFLYAGFIAVALLPFALVPQPFKSTGLLLRVWVGYALWIFVPFALLLLASGVPLQH